VYAIIRALDRLAADLFMFEHKYSYDRCPACSSSTERVSDVDQEHDAAVGGRADSTNKRVRRRLYGERS
jgi:hypothetical protein